MKEHKGDLWEHFGQATHRVGISTNGHIKVNGEAVMGRGCALQATRMFKGLSKRFGAYLREHGNVPGYLFVQDFDSSKQPGDRLMILPVKHNWYERADLGLVQQSVSWLSKEAYDYPDWTFHVPRLGCGNGRLEWDGQVRPLMERLPNNVWVHY